MLSLGLALLYYFLPYLIAAKAAQKRELSNRQLMLMLASVFFLGPLGILVLPLTTRFSKYKGNEFRRKQIEYELPQLEAKLKKLEKKEQKARLSIRKRRLSNEIKDTKNIIDKLKEEYISIGGKFKDKDFTIDFEIYPGRSPSRSGNQEQELNAELSPEEKREKQRKTRDIYNEILSNEGESLSRSHQNQIKH